MHRISKFCYSLRKNLSTGGEGLKISNRNCIFVCLEGPSPNLYLEKTTIISPGFPPNVIPSIKHWAIVFGWVC